MTIPDGLDRPTTPMAAGSNALTDAIFAHTADLVMFSAADGTIGWVSPACRHLLGLEPEALVGRNGFEMIEARDRERVEAEFAQIPNLGDQICLEFRVVDGHGGLRTVEDVVTNLLDDPAVGAIVSNLRDITDRRKAEEAVRFQARLLAAAGQPIIAVDTHGQIIYWNNAATLTFGWSATEAIGAPVAQVLPAADGWGVRADAIRLSLNSGQPWSGELWVEAKGGTTVPVLLTETPMFDDTGGHVATIGVASDITAGLQRDAAAARLSSIVECSNDAIFSVNLEGIITTWNQGAVELYDFAAGDIVGRHASTLFLPDRTNDLRDILFPPVDDGTARNTQTLGRRADGTRVHLSVSVSPIRDASGAVVGASTIARDVTEGVLLHKRVDDERRRLAEAQASARLGSFDLDLETGGVTRSAELWRILGLEPGALDDIDFDHIHPEDRERVRLSFDAAVAGQPESECTHRIVRPDGEVRWVVSRSRRASPDARVLSGTMLDITERREAELALAHQATHDVLTGLPNRTNLIDRLRAMLELGDGRHVPVAVAFLDLDEFKLINDTLGHAAGDLALASLGQRISAGLDPRDLVGRVGGDEFVLVRRDVHTLEEARAFAAEASRALERPLQIEGRLIHVTASIGVTISDRTDTPDSVLRDADAAMYLAKNDGGNRINVFDARSRAREHRRLALQTALRTALERAELRLEYQPVLDLGTLEVAGFEALLRWDHPELGPVSPGEFIPIAEQSGLIVPIGDWVLERAVRQLADWRAGADVGPEIWVAINLCATQLGQPGLVARLAGTLEQAGVPPALIHLEITETVLMDQVENALATTAALQDLGVRISIDDFGTGSSSLSYLNRFSIDILKIDQSFVQGIESAGTDTTIVRAIAALASALHLDTVAEGIELPGQLARVRELGCTYGQGFLWSRSLPPAEALAWMAARERPLATG